MPLPHIPHKPWLATTLASMAMMMSASSAAAGATFNEVLTDLGNWGLVMAEHAGGPADSFEDIEPDLAGSFWYEGLAYEPPFTISTEPEPTAKLARAAPSPIPLVPPTITTFCPFSEYEALSCAMAMPP